MRPPAPAYYPALTGLRALAALAVFGFHQRGVAWFSSPTLTTDFRALLGEMHLGVSVFFTLSGFLLTRRYAGRRFTPRVWLDYLVHRVARIAPVYVVLTTATFLTGYFDVPRMLWNWLELYAVNVTLLKGLTEEWYLTGISPAWSLTVEEGFYLLAPLVFGLGWRFGPRRAWPLLALAVAGLGLGLYALLPALGTYMFVLKATIFGRLTEFLVGAGFAWFFFPKTPEELPTPLPARRRLTLLGGLALLLAVALLVGIHHAAGVGVSIVVLPGVLANNLLLPWATGLLLVGLATERTWLSRGLGAAPMQVLGRASYCFYLLHMSLVAQWLKPWLVPALTPPVATLGLLALLWLASIALYYALEKPAHRWLLSRWHRFRGATATAVHA
jgi:peptidoglycan/LPS O-acetylase OafA/YrhL